MALVENQDSNVMQNTNNEEEIFYRVYPDISRRIDYKTRTVHVEIALPGVEKSKIDLKALPTWFHLEAPRKHIAYNANQSWGIEIVPEKTEAKYNNGLLEIVAHIKDPMADAKSISLS